MTGSSRRARTEDDMTDQLFTRLKPPNLDELTEEAYGRRRSADLRRAFATPREVRGLRRARVPRRRALLFAASTAAAGVAAAVIIVPGPGGRPPSPGVATGTPATAEATAPVRLDTKSFLLAAAVTAEREPAGSGRYWYSRRHVLQRIRVVPDEYQDRLRKMLADKEKKGEVLLDKGDLAEELALPYVAYGEDTQDSWRARDKGDDNRSAHTATKLTFGSPADRTKWTEAGSPDLLGEARKARTADLDLDTVLSIDNPSLTMRNVDDLPTGKAGLAARLRDLYAQKGGAGTGTFAGYLWQTGIDLLAAPTTPGTRAALYRVLADQPGLTSKAGVTDALGREGVALTTTGPDDDGVRDRIEYRMIVDPATARLLGYEVAERGDPGTLLRVSYEDTGWVDRLGEHPAN